jgi:hypothetical protein
MSAPSNSKSVEELRARVASAADQVQELLKTATPEERSQLLKQIDQIARNEAPQAAPAPTPATPATPATPDAQTPEGTVPDAPLAPGEEAPVAPPLGVQKPVADSQARFISGKTQPRDARGKFQQVLALLKENLGTSGNQGVLDQLAKTEELDNVGNYQEAAGAAADLIGVIDRLDSGALNAKSVDNVRLATKNLGKTIANLPLPFGNQAEKVRYTDLPPALRQLTEDMIKKVEAKIGKKDSDIATADLRGFMSGSDLYSQSEVSSQLNKLLRLLT